MRSSKAFQEISAKLLSQGHSMCFRAEGNSMHPTIREGEAITVEPVAPFDVKRGDILLCRSAWGVIAHRVVAIKTVRGKGSGVSFFRSSILDPQSSNLSPPSSAPSSDRLFILRGDALNTCDEPLEMGRVLGKVVSVERDGRTIDLSSRRAKLMHNMRLYAFRLARLTGINRFCRPIKRILESRPKRSGRTPKPIE